MIAVVLGVVGFPWFKTSFAWAMSNLIFAQQVIDTTGDSVIDLAIKIGGVTVPFGVGWFWNRQYLKAKDHHNAYLLDRVEAQVEELRQERAAREEERAAKEKAWADLDALRQKAHDELQELRVAIAAARAEAK